MSTENAGNLVAQLSVTLVILAGAIPVSYLAAMLFIPESIPERIDTFVVFLRSPSTAITFSILFCFGSWLSIQTGRVFNLLGLLPLLVFAIWPVFRGTDEELPVPSGSIVAFAQSFERADTEAPCPRGWDTFDALSGRMALGAGIGEGLLPRAIGDPPGGQETHVLTIGEIPSHSHTYSTTNNGQLLDNGGNFPAVPRYGVIGDRATSLIGGGNAHNNMPPYFVVQFCIRN